MQNFIVCNLVKRKSVLQQKINQWLNTIWYNEHKFKWKYLPLSALSILYRIGFFLHQLRAIKPLPVPVIVVGNLTVGGTGKTPVVAWLAEWLQIAGFKPGIVSRGYRAQTKEWPHIVNENTNAEEVGDEALMLFLKTRCPVVIDPNRVRAARKLLSDFNCNILISDDGLQHRPLGRDIEIIVIDGERRFGNGHCLPLGPLREPVKRLQKAPFVICNGKKAHQDEFQMEVDGNIICSMHSDEKVNLADVTYRKIHAVAGIGHPERFFHFLEEKGLQIIRHAFPDHHRYQASDFQFLAANDIVLMTEKDAVKCRDFMDARFFYLPITAKLPPAFIDKFKQALDCAISQSNV